MIPTTALILGAVVGYLLAEVRRYIADLPALDTPVIDDEPLPVEVETAIILIDMAGEDPDALARAWTDIPPAIREDDRVQRAYLAACRRII